METSLITSSDSEWLEDVDKLVFDVPARHSRYQIEHFIVCKAEWPPDIQYKQCLRELQVRSRIVKERQFEFRDITLKADALRLEIEKEKDIPYCINIDSRVSLNKIAQLENQIKLLEFNAKTLVDDVKDILREMKILHELSRTLENKRKFKSIEEADSDYWSKI
jgi:hypothetical protein